MSEYSGTKCRTAFTDYRCAEHLPTNEISSAPCGKFTLLYYTVFEDFVAGITKPWHEHRTRISYIIHLPAELLSISNTCSDLGIKPVLSFVSNT